MINATKENAMNPETAKTEETNKSAGKGIEGKRKNKKQNDNGCCNSCGTNLELVFGIHLTKKMHYQILALLCCLELLLAFSNTGYRFLPSMSINSMHILVIIAAMLLTPCDACIVALLYSLTNVWKAQVNAVDYENYVFSPLRSGNFWGSLILTFVTTLLFAVCAGEMFNHFFKLKEKKGTADHCLIGVAILTLLSDVIYSICSNAAMYFFFEEGYQTEIENFTTNWKTSLLEFVMTVIIVCVIQRVLRMEVIQNFFNAIYEDTNNNSWQKKLLYGIGGLAFAGTIFLLFKGTMSRVNNVYIMGDETNASINDTINMATQLIYQSAVAFTSTIIILGIAISWMNKYNRVITKRARDLADQVVLEKNANKAKSDFLSSMSHDIRTPMNAIIGFTDIAVKHIDDKARVIDSLDKIKASSKHLLSLINDVLDMSKIESGKMTIQPEACNLDDVTNDFKNMIMSSIENKKLTLTVDLDAIEDKYVFVDSLRLNQVFMNLVGNSVKFTDEGGSISVTGSEGPCDLPGFMNYTFQVKDTGCGMSEDYLPKIFESFSREQSERAHHTEGTGLGMSICKNIVTMMGGEISVTSELGVGTEFTFTVPLKLQDSESIEAQLKIEESKAATTVFEGKKLLLVEDNELNREIALEILEEEGFLIETACDGSEALEKVSHNTSGYYDAVLMDIQMPIMNGYEATDAIRKLPETGKADLPIIAMTANAFEEDRKEALAHGMNAHVTKPIDIAKLKETLGQVLVEE